MVGPTEYQWVITSTNYDSDPKFPRWLRFDGIDDYLNLPYMGLYANGSASVVIAADLFSSNFSTIISERNTATATPLYLPMRMESAVSMIDAAIRNDANKYLADTSAATVDNKILSSVDTGSNLKLYSGSVAKVNANYTRSGVVTLNNTTIGASVSTTTANYVGMSLYGIIITKSALSDAQRIKCERFLAQKSGVLL